jgi:son of sevenless-like protein
VNKDQAPPPIIPRNINKKLKLLDIDPLEIARQLTIMEYQLFMKIRPMECILRSREQRAGKVDHITALIQSSNAVNAFLLLASSSTD